MSSFVWGMQSVKRLGHANKSTTLNIYTHVIKSADEAAAEMLENILNLSAHYKIG